MLKPHQTGFTKFSYCFDSTVNMRVHRYLQAFYNYLSARKVQMRKFQDFTSMLPSILPKVWKDMCMTSSYLQCKNDKKQTNE